MREQELSEPPSQRTAIRPCFTEARTDDHIGFTTQQRVHQVGYVLGAVLTVTVAEDEDVVAPRERVSDPSLDRPSVAEVAGQL